MRNLRNVLWVLILISSLIKVANQAKAEGAGGAVKVVQTAAKSKAALKFAEIIGTYLIGKGLDEIYASYTAPDPKKLDETLTKMQTDHPDYTLMLGTLRRAVKTDGKATTRAEFESLARDMIFQLDHAQLNSTQKTTPSVQWNPATAPLSLPGYGLGTTLRQTSLFDRALIAPTGTELFPTTPRLTYFPILPLGKEESVLAAKLVGAWSFSNRNNLGRGADVYIFHRNGKITEYKVLEHDEIYSFNGTYTVEGKKLTIRWELSNSLSDVLSATIEEIDGGHIKYSADKGILDLVEPSTKTLTRISDVGQFSVVTLSNPTSAFLRFQTRWATVQGTWSPWENLEFEPGAMLSIPYQGGFFCQISFDSSLSEDGRQEKTYELPFNVVSSPQDPKLLEEGGYRITLENDKIDLMGDKLTLPTPGVR